MHKGADPTVLVVAMMAYFAFVGLMIFLAIRWSRRRLAVRNEVLSAALQQGGGRMTGVGKEGGLYEGTEHEYDLGGQRIVAGTSYFSRSHYRVSLRLAEGAPRPWVVIYPEAGVDRFGKAIGLNREIQTGDQAFDDAAYIDTTEADGPVKLLLESGAVREAIRGILGLGYKVQFSEKGVEAFQLVAVGALPATARLGEVVALLGQLGQALPGSDPATFKGKTPFGVGRALAVTFSWILMAVLGGLLDGLAHSPGGRTLDSGSKVLLSLLGAFTVWVLYTGAFAALLRGRSYAIRGLLFVGFFGLLSTSFTGVIGVLALNQSLDASPAETRTVTVLSTSAYRNQYSIHVDSWINPGTRQRLPVSSQLYQQLSAGSRLELKVHQGFLGLPWVEPIRPE